MKIAFLSNHPGFGGAATANAHIVNMLSKLHTIYFIDQYIESTEDYLLKDKKNITVTYYPIRANKYMPWKISELLKSIELDCIIIGMPFLLIFYWPILLKFKCKGVKIVTIFHSLMLGGGFKPVLQNFLISIAVFVNHSLVFVSEFTRKSWEKYPWVGCFVKDRQIIYNAVQDSSMESFSGSVKNIVFVSRISKEKQPKIFCELAKRSSDLGFNYNFHIWGDGILLQKLMLKYESYVKFHQVSRNTNEIYNGMDLLILTSKFENCPMTILEAKVRGIPIIAPKVGGIPEILSHTNEGVLIENVFDYQSLFSAIAYVDSNYLRLSRYCKYSSQRFLTSKIEIYWHKILN